MPLAPTSTSSTAPGSTLSSAAIAICSTVPITTSGYSAAMPILDDAVERYIRGLRPERSPVMAEMEAVAERDGVPIVFWETGRFLAALCRALDPVVLEVGTAIGYSTLHMAEQLTNGRVITLELDADRARQARGFLERAGVAERVELIE